MRAAIVTLLGLFALGGCSTVRTTSPPRSAQEELLISTAADRAAAALAAQMPSGVHAYLDTTGISGPDAPYAVAAIEDQFLRHGMDIVADRTKADTVVILRSGALATYETSALLGLPPFAPPMAPSMTVPEIALYKDDVAKGIAKFAATAYDPKTGKLVTATDPAYGFSDMDSHVLLFLFSWNDNDTCVDFDASPPRTKASVSAVCPKGK